MRHFFQYIRELFTGWQGIMSSTASIVFLIGAFVWKWAEQGQLRYWLVAAFASFAIASYLTWLRVRPDLRIEIQGISLDHGTTHEEIRDRSSIYVTVRLCIVNTHSADNSIKTFKLTIDLGKRQKIESAPIPTYGLMLKDVNDDFVDLDEHKYAVLKQGWSSPPGWVRFLLPTAKSAIVNKKFTLTVTDAYNVGHRVKGTIPDNLTRDIIRVDVG